MGVLICCGVGMCEQGQACCGCCQSRLLYKVAGILGLWMVPAIVTSTVGVIHTCAHQRRCQVVCFAYQVKCDPVG